VQDTTQSTVFQHVFRTSKTSFKKNGNTKDSDLRRARNHTKSSRRSAVSQIAASGKGLRCTDTAKKEKASLNVSWLISSSYRLLNDYGETHSTSRSTSQSTKGCSLLCLPMKCDETDASRTTAPSSMFQRTVSSVRTCKKPVRTCTGPKVPKYSPRAKCGTGTFHTVHGFGFRLCCIRPAKACNSLLCRRDSGFS